MKTSELEGMALDWATAKAAFPLSERSGDRLRVRDTIDGDVCTIGSVFLGRPGTFTRTYSPSADWSQGGPLIENHAISLIEQGPERWSADIRGAQCMVATTPLVAICRALVDAKLGDEVEIPAELTPKQVADR